MTNHIRRTVLKGAAAAGAAVAMASAAAQVSSDQAPKVLQGNPMPEPPAERSAGPIRPGRIGPALRSAGGSGIGLPSRTLGAWSELTCAAADPIATAAPAVAAPLSTVRQI